MTNELKVFEFENSQVRTAQKDGDVWFCLTDVCKVLDITNTRNPKQRLNEKGVVTMDTLTNGGKQALTFINEPNLYKVIFQSRKPEAEKFTDWVTSEVLPSIRKTGQYSVQDPIKMMAQSLIYANQLITEMKPKADFYDTVTGSKDAIEMKEVAKVLNMGFGRNKLFEFLRNEKILDNKNQPYQKYIDLGYFRVIEMNFATPDGETHINFKTVVYQKGVDFIRRLIDRNTLLICENSSV